MFNETIHSIIFLIMLPPEGPFPKSKGCVIKIPLSRKHIVPTTDNFKKRLDIAKWSKFRGTVLITDGENWENTDVLVVLNLGSISYWKPYYESNMNAHS